METEKYLFDAIIAKRQGRLIYKVIDKETNKKLICKQYDYINDFISEFNFLNSLNHKGIYKIKDFFILNNKYHIIFDFYEKTLYQLLSFIDVTKELKKKWIFQLIDIISYIHSKNIVHLDLKTDNVMLDKHNNIIIIDFGISQYEGVALFNYENADKNAYPKEFYSKEKSLVNKSLDIWMLANIFKLINLDLEGFNNLIYNMKQNKITILDIINSNFFKNNYDKSELTIFKENKPLNILKNLDDKNFTDSDIWIKFVVVKEKQEIIFNKYKELINIFQYNIFEGHGLKISKNNFDIFKTAIFYISCLIYNYNIFIEDLDQNKEELIKMVDKILIIMYREKQLFYIIEDNKFYYDNKYEIRYIDEFPEYFYISNIDDNMILEKMLELDLLPLDINRVSNLSLRSFNFLNLAKDDKYKKQMDMLFTCFSLYDDEIIKKEISEIYDDNINFAGWKKYIKSKCFVSTRINQFLLPYLDKDKDENLIYIINNSKDYNNIYSWLDSLSLDDFNKYIKYIIMDKMIDDGYFFKKIYHYSKFENLVKDNFINFTLLNNNDSFLNWCINEKLHDVIEYFIEEIIRVVFIDITDDFPEKEKKTNLEYYKEINIRVNNLESKIKKEHLNIFLYYKKIFEKLIFS